MRFIAAIFLVALFGALNANKAVFHELAQINKHPFGATMLAAVSTNLRAKTPIQDVQNLIAKILSDLENDSASLDKNHDAAVESANNNIAAQESLIATYEATIAGLQSAIEDYEREGVSRVNEYAETTDAIRSTQDAIDTEERTHSQAAKNFQEDIDQLNAAIAACNQALEKMNTYQSATGAALIQVASAAKAHLHAFSKTMKHMSKKLAKHGSMYAPLIHELVELTADVENVQGGRVVELLQQLLQTLVNALNDLTDQAATEESSYQTRVAQLTADLEGQRSKAAFSEQRIQEINVQETQALANLEANRGFRDASQELLETARTGLDNLNSNYAEQRERFDNCLSILRRLQKHFDENVAAVDEWTASQVNGEI